MFDFLQDAFNYEDRKVENTVIDGSTVIDTARVSDGEKPYETAIECPKYNDGKWVIVESYVTLLTKPKKVTRNGLESCLLKNNLQSLLIVEMQEL